MKRASAAVAIVVVSVLGACGGAQSPKTSLPGAKLLRHVPVDTAYLMASLEPPPPAEVQRATERSRKALAAWREQLAKEPSDRPGHRLALAFLDELEPNTTVEGLTRIGIGTGGLLVVYGIGVLPALRLGIQDGRALEATVGRIVAKAGGPAARQGPHGSRWEIPIGPHATAVIAVTDDELLAALLPTRDLDRDLALLYGDSHLGPSLSDSPRIGDLVTRHRLSPRFLGWLDLDSFMKGLADKKGPIPDQLQTLTGAPAMTPACLSDVAGLVAHMPRIVFGAQEIAGAHTRGTAIVEMDPELARDLAALRTIAIGVGAPLGNAVLSFGLGFDVPRAIELLRGRARRVLEKPFTCPPLLEWNVLAAKLDEALAQTIPPWVYELRGLAIELIEMNMGGSFGPRGRGAAVISAADPIRVIDIAKRFMPQLSGVNPPPDGKPIKVPGGVLFLDAWVAMKGQLLGVAIGEGSELELVRLMSERPLPSQPLFSMAGDGEKIGALTAAMAKEKDAAAAPPSQYDGKFGIVLAPDAAGLRLDFDYEDSK